MLSRNDIRIKQRRLTVALPVMAAALLAATLLLFAGCSSEDESKAADLSVDTGGTLQIENTEYDIGEVPIGEAVTHSFEIRNSGAGSLSLGEPDVKMLEGCWSADAVVGSTTIAPGETTSLDVSVHMGKGMGGMHLIEVTVPSNDPEATNNRVQVRVNYIE